MAKRSSLTQKIAHIRRDDEIESTYCDLLTVICIDSEDLAPIAMVGLNTETHCAIYADVDVPEGWTTCPACYTAYFEKWNH